MKTLLYVFSLFLACHSFSLGELKTYPSNIWHNESALRVAIAESYPGLRTRSYHFNNYIMHGILEDTENQRVLFLLYTDPAGALTIFHNCVRLAPSDLSLAVIQIAGTKFVNNKTVDDYENTEFLDVGLWIPMRNIDTLSIESSLTWPAKYQFSIQYDPNQEWRSSATTIEADLDPAKTADVFMFSDGNLLSETLAVLAKKKACLLKIEKNLYLTIEPWKKEPKVVLSPMTLEITDQVKINFTSSPEVLGSQHLVKDRLEAYVAASHAGGQSPYLRLRVTPNTNDKLFRETLKTIAPFRIRKVLLEDFRK